MAAGYGPSTPPVAFLRIFGTPGAVAGRLHRGGVVLSSSTAKTTGSRHAEDREWRTRGQPLNDVELRAELSARLDEVADLTGAVRARSPLADFNAAEQAIEEGVAALDVILPEQDVGSSRTVIALLRDLVDLQARLQAAQAAHRQQAFNDVQAALARLRSVGSIQAMIEMVPAEVCRCGFDRCMISRVRDSMWVPEHFHIPSDPEWGAEIIKGVEPLRIDHLVLESEMVRRRAPLLVEDGRSDPRAHPNLIGPTRARSYVAVPIMPEDRIIGFIHADCYMTRRVVDEFDRDVLWMLAEGIGYAFERTVLQERLHELRGRVRSLTDSIGGVVDELVDAEVELQRVERAGAERATPALTRSFVTRDSELATLLTRRELDIMQLMAQGYTNSRIAQKLIISDGTVKTHVKHILRKLGAENRVEAVSKYLRLSAQR